MPTDLLKVPSKSALTRGGGGSGSGNLSKFYKESVKGSILKHGSAATTNASSMLKRHSTRIIPEEVIKAYLNINEGNNDKPRRNSVMLNPFNMQSNLLHSSVYPEGGGTLSPYNTHDLKTSMSKNKS